MVIINIIASSVIASIIVIVVIVSIIVIVVILSIIVIVVIVSIIVIVVLLSIIVIVVIVSLNVIVVIVSTIVYRLKGPSTYDVHKKIGFLTPSPVHMRPYEPDPFPCGRPHAVDMKYTLLS